MDFVKNLNDKYNDALIKYKDNKLTFIELEARFKKIDDSNNGYHHIKASEFYRLKINLEQGLKTVFDLSHSLDEIESSTKTRKTTINGNVSFKVKTNEYTYDLNDYGIRYSVNSETDINPPKRFAPDIKRYKKRYSCKLYNDNVVLDLTEVTQDNTNIYEIELEKMPKTPVGFFVNATREVFKALHETETMYSKTEIKMLCDYIRNSLTFDHIKYKNFENFNRNVLVQARNIKSDDLVFGGIIGNTKTTYSVTPKADGLRKLLVFHQTGVWLIMPPFDFNLIMKIQPDANAIGIVLDGELITMNKRRKNAPQNKYWFLAFDCLATPSSSNSPSAIQERPLNERMKICTQVAQKNSNNILHINAKAYEQFLTPEEFFAKLKKILFELDNILTYETDGVMFTPDQIKYNFRSHEKTDSERVLTNIPDICKWKPSNELTIDFSVKKHIDKTKVTNILMSSAKGQREGIVFDGTDINPYNNSILLDPSNMLAGLQPGTVVEFEYKDKMLLPKRIRFDKPVPNNIEVAKSVWNDIFNPIEKDTLTGENTFYIRSLLQRTALQLVEPFENDITEIYIFTNKNYTAHKVLFNKLAKKFKKVVLIVPSEINHSEEYFLKNIDVVKEIVKIKKNSIALGFLNNLPNEIFTVKGLVLIEINVDKQLYESYTNIVLKDLDIPNMIDNTRNYGLYNIIDSYTLNFEPMMSVQERDIGQITRVNIYDTRPRQPVILPKKLIENYDFPIRRTWLDLAEEEEYEIVELPYPSHTSTGILTCTTISDVISVNETEREKEEEYEEPVLVEPEVEAIKDLDQLSDDDVAKVRCSWFTKVVRIGAIGDGSCFIHAVLKGYHVPYQNGLLNRSEFVSNLRKAIRNSVNAIDPLTNASFYDSAGGGQLAELGKTYKPSSESSEEAIEDFSIENIREILDSNDFLGEEVFSMIAEMLLINIHVVRITKDDIFKHASYYVLKNPENYYNVVVAGDGSHFETIGVVNDFGYINTAFESNDELISKLK